MRYGRVRICSASHGHANPYTYRYAYGYANEYSNQHSYLYSDEHADRFGYAFADVYAYQYLYAYCDAILFIQSSLSIVDEQPDHPRHLLLGRRHLEIRWAELDAVLRRLGCRCGQPGPLCLLP